MITLADALCQHLESLEISEVEVLQTERDESFRGSDVSTEASVITASARSRHLADGYGFWEHVLALAASASGETLEGLVLGAVRENSKVEHRERMGLPEFVTSLRSGRWSGLPGRQIASLSTRVVTADGETCHLFVLDMGMPGLLRPNAVNAAMKAIGVEGLIVSSGRSFHVYVSHVGSWDEYVRFLASCALLSPIVDSRWALRQIVAGRGALRISTSELRDRQQPVPVSSEPTPT